MKKQPRFKDEDGSVLIVALSMLVLLTLLGFFVAGIAEVEIQVAGNDRRENEKLYGAEGGALECAEKMQETADLDPGALAWLDPPPAGHLTGARALLKLLGALDSGGRLTPLGKEMAQFPAHPRLARLLIAAREATLRLHHHEPGTLPAQAKYLHQRTGGMIGSLTHLIRGAAIRAILGGQEALTRGLLDPVRIDHAAESATRRVSSTR